ncbi:MAG: T9SS type A sorting domain-containing protein [Bacteroidota bacterium]
MGVAGSVTKKYSNPGTPVVYTHVQSQYSKGNNFYRIVQKSLAGKENISAIKIINTGTNAVIAIGPNPTKNIIYMYNSNDGVKYLAQVFDKSGRMVYAAAVDQTQQYINVSHLQKGSYILKLSSPANNRIAGYPFIKW